MTNKNDKSPRGNQDQNKDFPGYPHYPPSEDIMNQGNDIERVPVDVENLAPTDKGARTKQPQTTSSTGQTTFRTPSDTQQEDLQTSAGKDAEVTEEDLRALNATDSNYRPNETGDDLDIPGAELDDANEEIGEEDEENNYYSLGGDNHED